MALLLQYRKAFLLFITALNDFTHNTIVDSRRGVINLFDNHQSGNSNTSNSAYSANSVNNSSNSEGNRTEKGVGYYINKINVVSLLSDNVQQILDTLLSMHNKTTKNNSNSYGNSDNSISNIFQDFSSHYDVEEISFAYSTTLVKLMQNSAIRTILLKPYTISLEYLKNICKEIKTVGITTITKLLKPICSTTISTASTVENNNSATDNSNSATDSKSSPKNPLISYEELLFTCIELSEMKLHLLSRSLLTSILYIFQNNIQELLVISMKYLGLPTIIVNTELVLVTWLPTNPINAAWETIKALCTNRNKLLSKLEQVLKVWATVTTESVYVDDQLRLSLEENDYSNSCGKNSSSSRQQWFSSWSCFLCSVIMDQYMLLLVEMKLLENYELDYFYWYWDYITSVAIRSIEILKDLQFSYLISAYEIDMNEYALQQQKYLEYISTNTISGGNKKKKNKNKVKTTNINTGNSSSTAIEAAVDGGKSDVVVEPVKPILPSKTPPSKYELFVRGKGQLVRGIFRTLKGAQQLGLISKAENRFTSWDYKFSQRFQAFHDIKNPPQLSHDDFLKSIGGNSSATNANNSKENTTVYDLVIDVNSIQSAASICYQNARKYYDEIRKSDSFAIDANLPNCSAQALQLTKVIKIIVGSDTRLTLFFRLLLPVLSET